jgi:hypothetical protein
MLPFIETSFGYLLVEDIGDVTRYYFLCDRRRVAAAFWIRLVWVAFCFWGLDCLQNAAVKGNIRVGKGC